MRLERVSLFNKKKDFFYFLLLCSSILFYSLLIEFHNYKNLTRFNSTIIEAKVLKQYTKTKNSRTYQILKLKTDKGVNLYTSTKKSFKQSKGKKLSLEIWAGDITFYEYLTSFYAYSKVLHVEETLSLKQELNLAISSQHVDENISNIYQALFTATPLHRSLQTSFSYLGVSHLLAISGFHLGVLSALLFFFFRPLYLFFGNRYFPYRNSKSDIFIIVAAVLLSYLLFLDSPPSLLRAFAMLLVGFVLYDRGMKIISMQTLLLTILLLLSFFPRLFFALGFWLSVSGVFYIFLFLIHFKHLSKLWQFILVPFWVYILMLPYSLIIFGSFSIYHPLSILWTTLFTLFYPLSIFLHGVGFGDMFDSLLINFIELSQSKATINLSYMWLIIDIAISLLSIFYRNFVFILLMFNLSILIYAIYQITQF